MLLEETRDHRMAKQAELAVLEVRRARVQQAEGMKISQLVADPNWELYGRYIEREKMRHEASAKAQEAALLDLDSPLSGADELRARLRLAHNRACVEAYTIALSIAKTIIEKGKESEGVLEKMKVIDTLDKQA